MTELIKKQVYNGKPVTIFQIDGRTAFLAKEIGDILGITKPSQSLAQSKTLEKGADYDLLPLSLLPEGNKLFPSPLSRVTIIYDSGLFLFILRSNKSEAIPFHRWIVKRFLSLSSAENQKLDVTFDAKDVLKLMELADKHKSPFAAEQLKKLGFKRGDVDEQQNFLEGGVS